MWYIIRFGRRTLRRLLQFLFKATTGKLVDNQYGCIMADEMGLGKTLQCIALLWTLLKQSPHAGRPSIQKCIIACPSSLVRNWANEFCEYTYLSTHLHTSLNKLQLNGLVLTLSIRWRSTERVEKGSFTTASSAGLRRVVATLLNQVCTLPRHARACG